MEEERNNGADESGRDVARNRDTASRIDHERSEDGRRTDRHSVEPGVRVLTRIRPSHSFEAVSACASRV